MNTKKLIAFLMLALLVAFAACAPSDPDPIEVEVDDLHTNGDPVVAIGNSLTAGYMNNGLVMGGQIAGYANVVARQITGTAPFGMTMPLVASPGIGGTSGFTPLKVTAEGALTRDPLTVDPTSLLLAAGLLQPYANLGVPGALSFDPLYRTGAVPPEPFSVYPANPFFDMVLRNGALPFGDATQLDQLDQIVDSPFSNPLLLMLWLGNNDVLGAATSGDPISPVNKITPTADFQQFMGGIAARVKATEIPMVAIGNVFSVTSAPYFTAVRGAIEAGGGNVGLINTFEDDVQLILLPAQAVLFQPTGAINPAYLPGGESELPSTLTLTSAELTALETAVSEFNTIIASVADANGWALVDANAGLEELPTDLPAALGELNRLFPLLPGPSGLFQNANSAFSLDGIHPSEKGYSHVANFFIDALNEQYAGLLNAVLGGLIDNVDVSAVQNKLGFEEFGTNGARGLPQNMVMTPEAAQALRELPMSR